jgi:hypothetical protein
MHSFRAFCTCSVHWEISNYAIAGIIFLLNLVVEFEVDLTCFWNTLQRRLCQSLFVCCTSYQSFQVAPQATKSGFAFEFLATDGSEILRGSFCFADLDLNSKSHRAKTNLWCTCLCAADFQLQAFLGRSWLFSFQQLLMSFGVEPLQYLTYWVLDRRNHHFFSHSCCFAILR